VDYLRKQVALYILGFFVAGLIIVAGYYIPELGLVSLHESVTKNGDNLSAGILLAGLVILTAILCYIGGFMYSVVMAFLIIKHARFNELLIFLGLVVGVVTLIVVYQNEF